MAMMKMISSSVLCAYSAFFVYIVCSSAAGDRNSKTKELVVPLDRYNFTRFFDNNNYVVLQFYLPGCDGCKKFAPEFEKAAAILSKEDPSIVFAKIDANEAENRVIARYFKADLHPAIQIMKGRGGAVHKYSGPLKADGVVAFIKKERGPAMRQLESAEEVGRLVADKKIVIVGIFPDELSGEKFKNFTVLAERLRSKYEYEVRHTSNAKLLPTEDSSVTRPVVRIFKPYDEPSLDFQDFDVDWLEKVIEESSAATVYIHDHDSRRNRPYMLKFLNSDDSQAFMFTNLRKEQKIDRLKAKFHQVATEHKGKGVRFAIIDLDANRDDVLIDEIKDDEAPLLLMITNAGNTYVKRNIEPDQISAWIREFQEGKLIAYIRSEPVPQKNDEPVKVIVGDTLDEMVLKTPKNVLLEVYDPKCASCIMLAPIIERIALTFANDADVMIAKIDGTANDIPQDRFGFGVKEMYYPTIYLKSASGKVLAYHGSWTQEDITAFIQKARDTAPQMHTAHSENGEL